MYACLFEMTCFGTISMMIEEREDRRDGSTDDQFESPSLEMGKGKQA